MILSLPRRIAALMVRGAMDFVYPVRCVLCGTLGMPVACPACESLFSLMPARVCRACGVSIDGAPELMQRERACARCILQTPYHFSWARARGSYEGVLREAIHSLKYDHCRPMGAVLGRWLRHGPGATIDPPRQPDIVLPVPLHPRRLLERGFNQSLLLARAYVGETEWPLRTDILRRKRCTRPQALLTAEQRAVNVRGAFAVRQPEAIAGKRLLLIDDVVTTMHTVDECARVLKEAGAAEVYVLAVAR